MHDLILLDKYKYKQIIFFPISTFFSGLHLWSLMKSPTLPWKLIENKMKWKRNVEKGKKMICLIWALFSASSQTALRLVYWKLSGFALLWYWPIMFEQCFGHGHQNTRNVIVRTNISRFTRFLIPNPMPWFSLVDAAPLLSLKGQGFWNEHQHECFIYFKFDLSHT